MVEDRTHVQAYTIPLLERIEAGKIDPSFVITHPAGHAPNVLDRTFEARSHRKWIAFSWRVVG